MGFYQVVRPVGSLLGTFGGILRQLGLQQLTAEGMLAFIKYPNVTFLKIPVQFSEISRLTLLAKWDIFMVERQSYRNGHLGRSVFKVIIKMKILIR